MAFFRTNPDMKRLESSLGPALRTYDPSRAITPAAALHSVRHCSIVSVQQVTALLQYNTVCGCLWKKTSSAV